MKFPGHRLSIAFSLLLICIVFASGATIHDGLAVRSLLSLLAALALVLVGMSARAVDIKFVGQATARLKLVVAIPALWMIAQILPLPSGAHSLWVYANEALDQQAWGHISIDLGETLLSLAFYLANIILVVVTLFVAKDRKKAELILLVLASVSVVITIVLLLGQAGHIARLDAGDDVRSAISSLGILLSLANTMSALERLRGRQDEDRGHVKFMLAASGIATILCIGGLAASATLNAALIAALGVVVFGSIQLVRRADLAGWATAVLLATIAIAAVMIAAWRYDPTRMVSPFLQFATAASADAISVTTRLLSDAGPRGTGAGTFAALVPLYQDLGGSITSAPSTAASFAIELGWPMTLILAAIAVWIIVNLYRGALGRGRDSFYAASAAACVVVILGQAFCDASLLNSAVAIVGDTIIGLGLAQSISARTSP
ncbi:hypothetical protein [Bradyrhizobium sp.]|uniref:hypothetical protein n=1 Tax=Bradyrhizobium sp. TaxID=376 RepID=UPI0039E6F3F4